MSPAACKASILSDLGAPKLEDILCIRLTGVNRCKACLLRNRNCLNKPLGAPHKMKKRQAIRSLPEAHRSEQNCRTPDRENLLAIGRPHSATQAGPRKRGTPSDQSISTPCSVSPWSPNRLWECPDLSRLNPCRLILRERPNQDTSALDSTDTALTG